jgi:hypothetical protein
MLFIQAIEFGFLGFKSFDSSREARKLLCFGCALFPSSSERCVKICVLLLDDLSGGRDFCGVGVVVH